MKAWIVCLFTVLAGGCSSVGTLFEPAQPGEPNAPEVICSKPEEPVPQNSPEDTGGEMPLSELLTLRQSFCDAPAEKNQERLDSYMAAYTGPSPSGEQEEQNPPPTTPAPSKRLTDDKAIHEALHMLMRATCDPAKTPGILGQLLDQLVDARTWPAEYSAFFELLATEQRAYTVVEREFNALKIQHEKTIQGLTDIEEDIDLHQKNKLQDALNPELSTE